MPPFESVHSTQTVSSHPANIFRTPSIKNPLTNRFEPAYGVVQPVVLITQLLIEHKACADVHPEDKSIKASADAI